MLLVRDVAKQRDVNRDCVNLASQVSKNLCILLIGKKNRKLFVYSGRKGRKQFLDRASVFFFST